MEAIGFTSFSSLMGKEESNLFGRPFNFMVPQDQQTPNNPMLSHWATTMQAFYNPESTRNPYYNHPLADGSYMNHQYILQNQANNAQFQCDALHDPVKLYNKPLVAEDAAMAFSEMVRRNIVKTNPDYNQLLFSRSSQPVSLITGESSGYGNQSSAPKNDKDVNSMSEARGSKKSPHEDQDDTNSDFTLSKRRKSKMTIGDVHVTNSLASCFFGENPSRLIQTLGTGVKESDVDADAQTNKMEADDIRKERKRQSNRESAKRARLRRKQQIEECTQIDNLKDENSILAKQLKMFSEACLKLTDENDSIQEELVKEYGPESIQDILFMKP